MRSALGITDGAVQVTDVGNLQNGKTGMLFVVRAETAIVRATVLHRRIPVKWHLWRFEEDFTAAPVVIHVIGHKHTLKPVLPASLQHVNAVVFEDDFGVYASIASPAQ